MQLLSFQKNSKKQKLILVSMILLVLLVAGIILYQTYSLFEESGEYDVIKGSVPNYLDNYDIKVNFKVDGKLAGLLPERDSGKGVESINCDKGAVGNWDYYNWSFNVSNLSNTKTTCTINFVTRYTDSVLNGTDPVIKDELIPVTIESNGTVHKADIKEKWYEYGNQEWANAVILSDENVMYQNGETIPESNIESYFVWIPRYKYKLFDMGEYEELTNIEDKLQLIDIVFGVETTNDSDTSCKTPMESGESGNCSIGKYMTHPAFLFFQNVGMWVGKFETGYKGASSASAAEVNIIENGQEQIQIKPNVYSWRNIQPANAFTYSYEYKRNLDSHMMKNTEWGAVAYLQHSQYGNHESVRINNHSEYKTGYAALNEPTTGYTGTNISCSVNRDACNEYGTTNNITQPWNTNIGVKASTTGNTSGIYDMSGGSSEYVMGVMLSSIGLPCSGMDASYHSGFNGPYCTGQGKLSTGKDIHNDIRYYDTYLYTFNHERYDKRILGDATGEMGPFVKVSQYIYIGSWYKDDARIIYSYAPWFTRGRAFDYGTSAGVFAFGCDFGHAANQSGFRVVLSI